MTYRYQHYDLYIGFVQLLCKVSIMVKFIQKLDRNKKIYFPKVLREAGFDRIVEILANAKALVAYPQGTDLEHVLRSLDVIRNDIKHRIILEEIK